MKKNSSQSAQDTELAEPTEPALGRAFDAALAAEQRTPIQKVLSVLRLLIAVVAIVLIVLGLWVTLDAGGEYRVYIVASIGLAILYVVIHLFQNWLDGR